MITNILNGFFILVKFQLFFVNNINMGLKKQLKKRPSVLKFSRHTRQINKAFSQKN